MGFQVVILDDGFQHRRLHRDLDIVLHSPQENLPLREPYSSIKRADILLLKEGAGLKFAQSALHDRHGVDMFFYSVCDLGFYTMERIKEAASILKEKRALVFCGIARPERFFTLLERAGIKPVHSIEFPDHFPYPSEAVDQILEHFSAKNAEVFITTEKDAVKLMDHKTFRDIPTYYLKIGIQTDEEVFKKIFTILQERGLDDA
jgi:tetraacyldisaccharide 4'-kinase